MFRPLAAIGLALTLAVTAQPVLAGEFDKQVKARKALMQVYAFNIGILGAMAKGQMPYDADIASAAAGNLLAAVSMKNPTMWPEGSSAADPGLDGKTRAKPEIWTDYPKVAEKSKALVTAATKMADEANNGLDAIKANIGAVGKGCKGCHKPFRVPKK